MKLYVGNISFKVGEDELNELFSQTGEVTSINLITDKMTGRPRGFGFVEYATKEGGQEAIKKFDGFDFQGRSLKVNEAKPREDRPQRNRY
jgi:RNA recognition motif-containing protein